MKNLRAILRHPILVAILALFWAGVAVNLWLQGDLWKALGSALLAALMVVAVIVEVRKGRGEG